METRSETGLKFFFPRGEARVGTGAIAGQPRAALEGSSMGAVETPRPGLASADPTGGTVSIRRLSQEAQWALFSLLFCSQILFASVAPGSRP